jgi:phosphoribosylformylglycinamidine (FGAM) synthase-like amidotransferase family enzyme
MLQLPLLKQVVLQNKNRQYICKVNRYNSTTMNGLFTQMIREKKNLNLEIFFRHR